MLLKMVISQPMYFPWVGMFEQVKLSDIFIHYDDVQFSKGSFTNRVQIKTGSGDGFKWLTVPLQDLKLGAKINEIKINYEKDWRSEHLNLLSQWYQDAPFLDEMLDLFKEVIDKDHITISDLSVDSLETVCRYYDLSGNRKFYFSSDTAIEGKSSERVLNYVKHYKCNEYITGLGALKYLDHELFEQNHISVNYMAYQKVPYPQQFGNFNPYVSILDLIANTGREGINYIISQTISWKELTLSKI